MTYRADIDSLRTLAVGSVILFHIWPDALPGGFLGVDIFFVISGALITQIIRTEIADGRFTFLGFYTRRVRRILPAQILVIVSTLIAGAFLLGWPAREALSLSAFYSALSLSNVYFYFNTGYFDQAAEFSPLLHMWSLGVEEQFYLIWPLLLVLIARARSAAVQALALGGAGLLSFVGVLALYENQPTLVFYMFPFRVFEFAIGGAICLFSIERLPGAARTAIGAASLLAVFACLFLISEENAHPGLVTLLPCIATAAAIKMGEGGGPFASAVGNAPAAYVGRLSYSLYLWHWPVIVFYRTNVQDALGLVDGLVIIAVTAAAAVTSYYLVEQPIRRGRFPSLPPGFVPVSVLAAVVATTYASLFLHMRAHDEVVERTHAEALSAAKPAPTLARQVGRLEGFSEAGGCTKHYYGVDPDCDMNFLVIGDSHSRIGREILETTTAEFGLVATRWYWQGCLPLFDLVTVYHSRAKPKDELRCKSIAKRWRNFVPGSPAEVIGIAGRWEWLFSEDAYFGKNNLNMFLAETIDAPTSRDTSRKLFEEAAVRTVDTLLASGKRVVLFGQAPVQPRQTIWCLDKREPADYSECPAIDAEIALSRINFANSTLRKIADARDGVHYVDVAGALCSSETCRSADGVTRLYRDDNHLSDIGSAYVGERVRDDLIAFLRAQRPT